MANVDQYNNIPRKREQLQPQIAPQYPQGNSQNYLRTAPMSRRPESTPHAGIDPVHENQLLKADLDFAINYIRQLGGSWPPPRQ